MADNLITTPLLDQNQNQSVSDTPPLDQTPRVSDTQPTPTLPSDTQPTPTPTLPSDTQPTPTLPSTPTSSPLRQNGNSHSPSSSSPGLFVSLQSCCPPSVLFNRRPGYARAERFDAPPSQQIDPQTPSNGQLDHLQGADEENIGGPLPTLAESLPTVAELISYRLGIDPMEGYKVSIRSEAELKGLWKLVLERREIQKYLENTIKSGREQSKILGFAGSLVILFSTLIDAELDEDLSNTKKVGIFVMFLVIIIVYTIVSNIQLHYIYDPALSDARTRYEDLLVMTNLARRKLLVLNSTPRVASSILKEWELQKKFDEYCKEIQKPLGIRLNGYLSFVELNSIAVALLMAFIVKGMPSKDSKPKHH